jgi:Spy/CpxP family protein refolding chaperone
MSTWFKPWMKRTFIGLAAVGALFGGLAAWAHHRHGPHIGWQAMSAEDASRMKARLVEKVGRKLDLDEAQKAKLGALADQLREGRNAVVASTPDPRAELRKLVEGSSFDRNKANALVQAQIGALTTQSPALINAIADFYDSLKPEQQAKVRDFMARRGRHGDRT